MCLPKILFPVFMFAFIFSLPLIFTLLAASNCIVVFFLSKSPVGHAISFQILP